MNASTPTGGGRACARCGRVHERGAWVWQIRRLSHVTIKLDATVVRHYRHDIECLHHPPI